ncbi:3-hydroxyacyl-CoA dehydrogenase NAD-binding domain-containing protein [Roseovarius aestuarii]|nr:3-hydroxyacyl-CoA dehydrogenase NAD-binding domain-containing protein [Roseovarius aestuarii]
MMTHPEKHRPIVQIDIQERIAVVTVDHPPLNVLSASVRQGIVAALDQISRDAALDAVVLTCAGKTFFSGADISEFGGEIAQPDLPAVIGAIAGFSKPIVAAMHGTALGGGFEVALACTARVADVGAGMGLPEVRLGLVPGCGGTTRLTRLAGPQAALDMVTSGRRITAQEALEMGVVDAICQDDLLAEAKILAARASEGNFQRPDSGLKPGRDALISRFRSDTAQKFRGQAAPAEAIDCVARALSEPLEVALEGERAAFDRLLAGPQAAALGHVFQAERTARKVVDLAPGTASRSITQVGVIGAGTMGRGIAMACAGAGLPVTMIDTSQDKLQGALTAMRASFERRAARGRLPTDVAQACVGRIAGASEMAALGQCDLIIEAVFEDLTVKEQVFRQIDAVARPGAIMATNTSFLDIDRIADATTRPDDVLGLHFFSPAHVMRLLEIVRGAQTAPDVLQTAMDLSRRMGKVGVCVGNCHGFVGNRMLARRQAAAGELILEGATPWQVDRALFEFGFPMGPFAMADLAGLDLGWNAARSSGETIEEMLCEAGRFGQKAGAGYYDYPQGQAVPSPLTETMLQGLSQRHGISRRAIDDGEILTRCLDPMIKEGRAILDEGIAARSSDIDTIWINGYGWPAWRGGPMYWADHR